MTQRYLLSIVGQSNEAGSATGGRDYVAAVGAPGSDSTTAGSWWPRLAELAGERGVWLAVSRTAVGSTSLCDSWVGRCRQWVSGMAVAIGSYVRVTDGGLWRSASTTGTSTTEPSGTTNTTLNSINWVYVGVATAEDVDGAIYATTSSRYDPNGYLATAITALTNTGFDRRGVVVSIGQGDHTVGSTLAQYSTAMQRVAEQFTAAGHTVWLGMTCYMAGTAARETTFQTVLLPGLSDALAALSGNQLVRAGANLRTALGVLPIVADQVSLGVQADELHMNAYTLRLAAAQWDAALQAGGW